MRIVGFAILSIWLSFVTLSSMYFAPKVFSSKKTVLDGENSNTGVKRETKSTQTINIPIIKDKHLYGYILARYSYVYAYAIDKKPEIDPENYINDAIISTIYSEGSRIGIELGSYDVRKLSENILNMANERIGGKVFKELFAREFNFVSARDVR